MAPWGEWLAGLVQSAGPQGGRPDWMAARQEETAY